MIYGVGRLTVAQMQRREASNINTALVSVDGGGNVIVSLDLGAVEAGDRVFVWAFGKGVKDVLAGDVILEFNQGGGTAAGNYMHNEGNLALREPSVPASSPYTGVLAGILKITTGGTYTLDFFGYSFGSVFDIDVGGGQIYAWVWPAA